MQSPKPPIANAGDRHARQRRFAGIGDEGQARLATARAALIGCGALGTHLAQHLVRAGVGFLRLCDRDVVDLSNLQRQVLYDEADVEASLPKAIAAARKLAAIDRGVRLDARVLEVSAGNVEEIVGGVDLVLDGTDNFTTRFLVNEACVAAGVPWVYGGVVAARGMVMPIVPGSTACLACILPDRDDDAEDETCDTAGVLGPAVAMVAAHQAAEAMKILCGARDRLSPGLVVLDVWDVEHRVLTAARRPDCPVCGQRIFRRLREGHETRRDADGAPRDVAARLCGGNAVRIVPAVPMPLDLVALERALVASGPVHRNDYLLRFRRDDHELLVFADGRALVRGTEEPETARALYRRWIRAGTA